MAFSLEERQVLGIHGLIPPRFKTQEEQVTLCKKNIDRYQEPLNKYIYLAGLQVSYQEHQLNKFLIVLVPSVHDILFVWLIHEHTLSSVIR